MARIIIFRIYVTNMYVARAIDPMPISLEKVIPANPPAYDIYKIQIFRSLS